MKAKFMMKSALMTVILVPLVALADTEIVNGIEWIYSISDGEATVGSGEYYTSAIPSNTLGAITVPSTLGGCPVTCIGEDAFYGCDRLTAVAIPSCVTSVGAYAFDGCKAIKSVTIPTCVERLSSTFPDAYSTIAEVIIADGAMSVGADAFRNCRGLTSVTIPESVTSIGASAFYGCDRLKAVRIPSGVTSIGSTAFYNCAGLSSVAIPSGVTSIEYGTFYNCSGLRSVTLPSSVTRIGESAFCDCDGLAVLTIPAGVTSIGSRAFYGCKNIKSLTIPLGVTSIEYGTFYGCSGLTSIALSSRVTSIDALAFYNCSGLTSLRIPSGVTSIGASAFYGCSGLKGISVPSGVTVIADSTFSNCGSLISVSLPSRLTSIGDYAFYDCYDLTSITIPSGVTGIGNSAFAFCYGLTSISLPTSVKTIGAAAFYYCHGLTSISLPSSVKTIGAEAFYYCYGLTSISLPTSVTDIGERAFYYCSGLTSVSIPSGVTSVGRGAFSNCGKLTAIEVDSGNKAYLSSDGVLYNRSKTALVQCPGGKTGMVTVPAGVTSIGDYAFSGCNGMTSVSIPSSVTSIGDYAFSGCNGMTSVSIPSSVTSIGDHAFYDCRGLASLSVPSSVTRIGANAFSYCSGLTAVTIPSSVTVMGTAAFSPCSALTMISVDSSNKAYSSADGILYNKSKTELIQCPGGRTGGLAIPSCVTRIAERAFFGCSRLTSVQIPTKVTSIGDSAFEGCSGLTSLTIPYGVTSIPYSLLDGCSGLKSIAIPKSVTSIGSYAFYRCVGLSSVNIPEGVSSIGSYAFSGCTNMTVATIPQSVTSIAYGMFKDCSKLIAMTIPDKVTTIGSSAFYNCSLLTTLTIPAGVTSIGGSALSGCTSLRKVRVRGESEDDVNDVKRMFASSGFAGIGVAYRLYDMRYAVFAKKVYDGLIFDANSNFVGVAQVKLTNQNDDTGVVTATATVKDANGATWSYTGGEVEILSAPSEAAAEVAVGLVTDLKCLSGRSPVARFDVALEGSVLNGDWGGNAIVGMRNGGDGDDDPTAEALDRCKGKWSMTVCGDRNVSSPIRDALRLQLNIQAKGEVSVAGNWESGESVSVSAQAVVLAESVYVPVILKATKTKSALTALIKIEGEELSLVSASDPTCPGSESFLLVVGGRTADALAISGYLAEDPGAAGADYVGRVEIDELAYPAKFIQKGLPPGLKLNASTGVVTGKPSKPGVYDVTFTATSVMNSKSNDICKVVIHIGNYAAPEIPVADSYGDYTPGVPCVVEIAEANGCTVSGLPSGLMWTAKEVRAKDGSLTAAPNSVYGIPTKPGNYTVYFKKKVAELNDKGKTVTVEHVSTSTFVVSDYPTIAIRPVLASDGIGSNIPLADGTNLVFLVGVAQSVSLKLEGALDGAATTVAAKGLPSGLKLVKSAVYVDPNAKKKVVDHYEYSIEGAPTAASRVDKKTNAVTPSHVTLSATNKYKWNGSIAFDVTVVALPDWAVGNFSGAITARDGSYHGTATLTVGKTGKVSGKIAAQGTNWTYSVNSYAGWSVVGVTNFSVDAVAKFGKQERQVVLAVAELVRDEPIPGVVEATAGGVFGDDDADLRRIVWKDDGGKVLASEYAGEYTYFDAEGVEYSIAVAESGTAKLVGQTGGKKTTLSVSLLTDLAEDGGLVVCGPFYKAPASSGKTTTPEFYRFVKFQNWHSEPIADGVATRNPGAILLVDDAWSGYGKVSVSPKYGQAEKGKSITLTASPDSGSFFVKWVVVDSNGNSVPGDPYAKSFKYVAGEEDVLATAVFVSKAEVPAVPTVLNADEVREVFAGCAAGTEVDVSLEIPDEARPVTFSVKNLPSGLKLDAATGRISGVLRKATSNEVVITLKAQRGSKPSTMFSFQCIADSEL